MLLLNLVRFLPGALLTTGNTAASAGRCGWCEPNKSEPVVRGAGQRREVLAKQSKGNHFSADSS